jgi:hypothetical protein
MSVFFKIDDPGRLAKAGPQDLIRMNPAPGANPLFLPKWLLDMLVYGIVHHEFIHLSGPSGSSKTSLLEALHLKPANFESLCNCLGLEPRPLQVFPIEMVTFESPGELYFRRALRGGLTYDEPSVLVDCLRQACAKAPDCYPLIWLREIGRVHSTMVQGGLLNLMCKGEVILPGGERLDCSRVGWVADSNYQAEDSSMHTLVPLDDALKRRFTINLTLDYLSPSQEVDVLNQLMLEE